MRQSINRQSCIRLGNRMVINNMQYGNSTHTIWITNNQNIGNRECSQTGQTLISRYINFPARMPTMAIITDGSGISLFTLTDTPCSYRNFLLCAGSKFISNSGNVMLPVRLWTHFPQSSVTGYQAICRGTYWLLVSEYSFLA